MLERHKRQKKKVILIHKSNADFTKEALKFVKQLEVIEFIVNDDGKSSGKLTMNGQWCDVARVSHPTMGVNRLELHLFHDFCFV